MPRSIRSSENESTPLRLARLLRFGRTAALVAALVPAAQFAVAPVTVFASEPVPVPEPSTMVLLLPAAAALLLKARR